MEEYINKHQDSMRLVKLEERVKQLEEDAKEFHKILEPIKDSNIRNEEHYKQITDTLKEIKDDVKALKERPTRFLDFIITAVIAGVVSFIISNIGNFH